MTTIGKSTINPPLSHPRVQECCMCGDYGFSYDLFQCKLCHFRSQHRYCSNLYPKAESYRICNWCLSQKEEREDKSRNSSNSSSPSDQINGQDHHRPTTVSTKKRINNGQSCYDHKNYGNLKDSTQKCSLRSPVKKQRSPELSPSSGEVKKMMIRNGSGVDEKLIRRTKSEEISNRSSGVRKHGIFRNKVRRYKLLDEVSS